MATIADTTELQLSCYILLKA